MASTPFSLVLVSILVLAQGSVIARDDYDLFWNGESEKNKKYLFFAPLVSGKTIKNNISGNMPPMQMLLTQGGVVCS